MKPIHIFNTETQDRVLCGLSDCRDNLCAGTSCSRVRFFFDVAQGWELDALADDINVRKVYTPLGLEDALRDPTVTTILIPSDSRVSRVKALLMCQRSGRVRGRDKTVFFETSADE